jgi:hypothetical protein
MMGVFLQAKREANNAPSSPLPSRSLIGCGLPVSQGLRGRVVSGCEGKRHLELYISLSTLTLPTARSQEEDKRQTGE